MNTIATETGRGPRRFASSVPAFGLVLLVAVVAWCFWPGLTGGLIFDDISNIVGNPALHVTTLSWSDWWAAILSSPSGVLHRPIAMFTFAINLYLTGIDAWPMKLTNIAIHAVNSLLVFGLTRALLRAADVPAGSRLSWAPLMVASLWALHPINFMAVLYVVQRMESLAHAFVFGGLWMYLAGRWRLRGGGRGGWPLILGGIFVGTGLGVLTKESAALLPVYALCVELVVLRLEDKDGRLDLRLAALFTLVVAIPAAYFCIQRLPGYFVPATSANRDFTVYERLLTEARVLLDYLQWTLVPNLSQLGLFHDDYPISRGLLDPPATLGAVVALLALFGAGVAMHRRRPLAALGIAWFFAAHSITATVIPLELVFEHRNYFASLGACLVLVDLAWLSPPRWLRPRVGAACLVALLVLCAGVTRLRAVEWSDPLRFAVSEAAKHPQSARATYNLARLLVIQTGFRTDSPSYRGALNALEVARNAPRSNLLPLHLSLIFASRTHTPLKDEWWDSLQHQLRTRTLNVENRLALIALNDCAVEGYCDFPENEMIASFSAALARSPDAGMLSVYGKYALHVLHDAPLALQLWREAAARGPRNGQFQVNLALLEIGMGRLDDAERTLGRLRLLGPPGRWHRDLQSLQRKLADRRAELARPGGGRGSP